MRKFQEEELIVATHNQGKAVEIAELLGPYVSVFSTSSDKNLEEPEETGLSFEENALIKARSASSLTGLPALADDSGLAVNALGGAPGIYSARLAGPEKDFNSAMASIHNELGDTADRSAAFICVLALVWPDGHSECFEGKIEGDLVWPPRGTKGFGYDPMFVAKGMDQSFAEIDPQRKHQISHRARAFTALVQNCFTS